MRISKISCCLISAVWRHLFCWVYELAFLDFKIMGKVFSYWLTAPCLKSCWNSVPLFGTPCSECFFYPLSWRAGRLRQICVHCVEAVAVYLCALLPTDEQTFTARSMSCFLNKSTRWWHSQHWWNLIIFPITYLEGIGRNKSCQLALTEPITRTKCLHVRAGCQELFSEPSCESRNDKKAITAFRFRFQHYHITILAWPNLFVWSIYDRSPIFSLRCLSDAAATWLYCGRSSFVSSATHSASSYSMVDFRKLTRCLRAHTSPIWKMYVFCITYYWSFSKYLLWSQYLYLQKSGCRVSPVL